LAQLRALLKIVFPSIFAKSSILLGTYTTFLVLRILLTIKIAKITGLLGKMIGAGLIPHGIQ
jgi:hypothetical protein